MSQARTIQKNQFNEVVLQSQKPVLVDFFATWCGPCKTMAPIIDQLAQEHPEIEVVKVDVDESPDLASEYNVSSIPTFYLFKNGQVVQTATGAIGKSQLQRLVEAE